MTDDALEAAKTSQTPPMTGKMTAAHLEAVKHAYAIIRDLLGKMQMDDNRAFYAERADRLAEVAAATTALAAERDAAVAQRDAVIAIADLCPTCGTRDSQYCSNGYHTRGATTNGVPNEVGRAFIAEGHRRATADIVAWLRSEDAASWNGRAIIRDLADGIERGDHLPPPPVDQAAAEVLADMAGEPRICGECRRFVVECDCVGF